MKNNGTAHSEHFRGGAGGAHHTRARGGPPPGGGGAIEADARGQKRWKIWGPTCPNANGAPCAKITVRTATPWEYVPKNNARSRAYRWGEDRYRGLSDDQQRFGLSLACGREEPISGNALGLDNREGTTAEDAKELYFTSTPRQHIPT